MNVMVMDHDGKSRLIAQELVARGCRLVTDPIEADVVLIDHDVPSHGKIQVAEACVATGGRAFIYPHGAGTAQLAAWDGVYPISPILTGVLATGSGHVEVARRYGYPHPVHDIGWTFCELRPRRTTDHVERIVFAATHPSGEGRLSEWELARNQDVFRQLLATPAQLTVRYIGSLEANGLWQADGVEYVQAQRDDLAGQLAQIDAADAVVSDRATFANLAVARGTTTVMVDSTIIAANDDRRRQVDHIDLYRDYIRFPFDFDDDTDLWELMHAAAADEDLVGDWRERFVGGPLDGRRLLEILEGDGAHLVPAHRAVCLHAAALQRLEAHDHAAADRLLAEAVRRAVDLELLNDLAVVRLSRGRRDEAEALLRACVTLSPTYAEARQNLAAIEQPAAT